MARRKLIAGNWKMNGHLDHLRELHGIEKAAKAHPQVDVAICPPATLIASAVARVPGLAIGAQDCHGSDKGAHTGCLSAAMLKEAGAHHVIVGHSERRADQDESDEDVRSKAEAAHRHGLTAILCVGETEGQRDAGEAEAVVTAQIAGSIPDGAGGDWLVIAYEPVWAIGTGRVPTLDDVAAMHGAIRAKLTALIRTEAEGVRILYGGSMNGDNAGDLLAVDNVDGGLVGGASLSADKFVPIIEAGAALA
ncbi:MAG: triose-phosphate isomerase [Pseudomonadota bacterium]